MIRLLHSAVKNARKKNLANFNEMITKYNIEHKGICEIVYSKYGDSLKLHKEVNEHGELHYSIISNDELISLLGTVDEWKHDELVRADNYRFTTIPGISKYWASCVLKALPSELPSVRVVGKRI